MAIILPLMTALSVSQRISAVTSKLIFKKSKEIFKFFLFHPETVKPSEETKAAVSWLLLTNLLTVHKLITHQSLGFSTSCNILTSECWITDRPTLFELISHFLCSLPVACPPGGQIFLIWSEWHLPAVHLADLWHETMSDQWLHHGYKVFSSG